MGASARVTLIVAALAVGASACAGGPGPSVARFDLAIQVTPGGLAEVEETIVLESGETQAFVRRVAPEQADAVEYVGASLGGSPAPAGAVTVDEGGRDRFRVTWHLDRAAAGPRELGLRYRVRGVLAIHGREGQLVWQALPKDRGYAVDVVRLVLTVPAGAVRVGSWGVAQPGWQVAELPNGIAAGRERVGADEAATLLARLAVEPGGLAEPAWQHVTELGRQLMPAFMAGGLFIVVVGLGVIWIIRFEVVSRTGRASGWRQGLPARTAEGLRTAGVVCLAFGLVLLAVVYLAMSRYGEWAFAVPVSVLMVGLMFLLVGRRARV